MEVTGQQLVDAFMNRQDLGGTEQVLKDKVLSINEALLSSEKELGEISAELAKRQAECERFRQQMGVLLGLIVDVEMMSAKGEQHDTQED